MLAASVDIFRNSLAGKSISELLEIAVELFRSNEDKAAYIAEYQNATKDMAAQFQQMKLELEGAKREIAELLEQNRHLVGVKTIQTNELFGRSTEKTEDILGTVLENSLPECDPLSEDAQPTEQKSADKAENRKRVKKLVPLFDDMASDAKPKKRKRMDLSKLPVQTYYDYDIDELNREHGEGNWRFAFWNATETVEVIRQITYVKKTYHPVISVGLEHSLVRIPYTNDLRPKSVVSASLLSQIMVDRNRMFCPMYRQEYDEERYGFYLSRQLQSSWILYATQTHLEPVYDYLMSALKTYTYQQCDETHYMVILDERGPGSKNFIWVHRSGELMQAPPIVVYCYEKTRGADHLRSFYDNLLDEIYLTCDAYSAYPCFAKETDGLLKLSGCMMHLRRRFVEALLLLHLNNMTDEQIEALPEVKAILMLREIYKADTPLKELSTEERYRARLESVSPKVDEFFDFIHSFDLEDPCVTEKTKDAVSYAINQEKLLRVFLSDGNIPIDNGACERSVRPVSLYRRNSLFSFSKTGAESNMIIFTLIETAKANGADPYYYLKYLLEQMPKHLYDKDGDHLPNMVPWSEAYREYETSERINAIIAQAPPSNERPRTPTKGKRLPKTA